MFIFGAGRKAGNIPIIGTINVTPVWNTSYINATPTVSANITSPQTVSSCEVYNGASWVAATLGGSAPNYTATKSLSGITGTKSFNVRATNPTGVGTGTLKSVTVDSTPPAGLSITAAQGPTVMFKVEGTETDTQSGIAPLSGQNFGYLIMLDNSVRVYQSNSPPTQPDWTLTDATIGDGGHYLDLYVYDNAGNYHFQRFNFSYYNI